MGLHRVAAQPGSREAGCLAPYRFAAGFLYFKSRSSCAYATVAKHPDKIIGVHGTVVKSTIKNGRYFTKTVLQ